MVGAEWAFRGWPVEAIEASRVRFDLLKMEQWRSEGEFFKMTGFGVKSEFVGRVGDPKQ